ncbi:hypothetical protein AB0I28_13210 [Phytomonospora sp. NPDC050363]|uniref:hypothetical protein n=1 Tax=Phytomonospora sp. NPDC050363 TaxID=3155642 RepID=UPI0033F6A716
MATRSTGTADLARALAVAAAALLQAVFGGLGGSGALGTSVGEVANAHPQPLLPGGGAFMIWNVIYLAVLALAGWQLLPGRRSRAAHRRTGWWLAAAGVLNAAWIIVFSRSWIALSEVVIVVLLLVLVMAWRALASTGPAESRLDRLLLYGTVSIYTGWVAVASVVGALTTIADLRDTVPGDGLAWAALIVTAALIALGLAFGRGVLGFALAVVWALGWIAAATEGSLMIAVIVLAGLTVVAVAAGSVRRRTRWLLG